MTNTQLFVNRFTEKAKQEIGLFVRLLFNSFSIMLISTEKARSTKKFV